MSPSFFDRGSGNNERDWRTSARVTGRFGQPALKMLIFACSERGFERPSSNIIRRVYEEHDHRVLLDSMGRQLRYLTVSVPEVVKLKRPCWIAR